ncbi:GGDEF domain-containing protein [Leucobacter sp.]
MAWLSLQLRRQNPHSLYLIFGALLLALTLVVDLVFHQDMVNPWVAWVLLLACVVAGVITFAFGSGVPGWIGISAVLISIAAQSYFLSLADDPQSVISSLQQMPVIAFYLGWFVPPRLAVPLVVASLAAFGTVMVNNPLLGPAGAIGAPVSVHGILSLLFCYSVGFYLWWRQQRVSATDPLTGVCNRRGFMERLESQLRRLTPQRGGFCVVAVDFDDFKRLNDAQGHAAGDAALIATVESWRDEVRSGDAVGRIGGDEFVLLLLGVDAEECGVVVDRLQQGSANAWSWGIAEAVPGDTVDELLARADRALYEQKHLKRGELRE